MLDPIPSQASREGRSIQNQDFGRYCGAHDLICGFCRALRLIDWSRFGLDRFYCDTAKTLGCEGAGLYLLWRH
jgi:hypothetical protein